jgi:hypothetical protein
VDFGVEQHRNGGGFEIMRRTGALQVMFVTAVAAVCITAGSAAAEPSGFLPGQRVLLDAHNCYPYKMLYADRVTRALATGTPLAIEMDLAWCTLPDPTQGRVVVAHGKTCDGDEPTLREYFFEKVKPVVEAALKEGNHGNWPLITLNINDLRGEDPAFLPAVWKLTGEYESWLCTAVKTSNPADVSPLDVKPILVLTNGDAPAVKAFYDSVPVGGKLRLFGGAATVYQSKSAQAAQSFEAPDLAKTLPEKASNFRRWWNNSWLCIEPEGQGHAGKWTAQKAARLKVFVDYGHKMGYWMRFFTLNGHGVLDTMNGWSPEYNFGSPDAVKTRWKAVQEAGADFIATDQYEEFSAFLKSKR